MTIVDITISVIIQYRKDISIPSLICWIVFDHPKNWVDSFGLELFLFALAWQEGQRNPLSRLSFFSIAFILFFISSLMILYTLVLIFIDW